MTDRINAEKAVRKSIEAALTAVIPDLRLEIPPAMRDWGADATPPVYGTDGAPRFPIWWPNQTFYANPAGGQDTKPPFFIRVSHHPAQPRVRTIGENPRVLLRGHTIIGCHIPEGAGEDLIDNLANAAMSAYPYAAVFTREGFDTHVELVDPKPAFGALGRYYKPVHINWSCWRTTP